MELKLETDRLQLAPYEMSYAKQVAELAGEWEVAATTFVPHPYTIKDAEEWIGLHKEWLDRGTAYPLAMICKETKQLIGTMTLRVNQKHQKGELAYWVGKPYWGKGYASEAAIRVVRYGFEELNLERIWAGAMTENSASSKVMQKAGLSYEGTLKKDMLHWGEFKDIDVYGMVREDFVLLQNNIE
ncbi:GNAT family N-acetyltransferase [Halobacillus mangrovi]|uniref:GNAT family N-acetyltransferase n=1 Tax=Halobacillus mangrovi TaxID=402384 RepID=A0A1W5ZQH1_9BACI|nr:GNAT family N-acetyltransferase [Halobacillus mangrovi]ARI75532.1 GNAT family N-acetyltransferase [Halobacillus mangrovi]